MILVIDCFKLVKGAGKSIGIYNLALNLVRNLVAEKARSADSTIQNTRILVLGTEQNAKDFKMEGVEFISMKYNPLNKLFCIFWELFLAPFYAKKYKADQIVYPRGFSSMLHLTKETIIVHDMIPFYYDKHYPGFFNKLENFYIMWRLKASIKHCDKVITISQASKQDILEYAHVREEKIEVINNGCNLIQPVENQKQDYFIAITSGLPHKNAEGIVKSYEAYYKRVERPLSLKIIGIADCDEFSILQEAKGHIECYKYIASNAEMHKMIADARGFLFLSLVEGFGFPPLEAMQLKTAVICSSISSLPEVVGDAALLVNPTDYKEVAVTMERLSQDEVLQEELIERGSKNVERFTWDKIVKQYWKALVG
ncbi:MAG: glycosyltransferase family 4 protein [Lachnospiraceae bacterium]|nr:glycosyltransferase family 4 protein [Lachnospiraceae bacterium]